jgi:hypothetical protein
MNEAQWLHCMQWADKLTAERGRFVEVVLAERAGRNLDKVRAMELLRRAGFHPAQIESIL